MILLSVIIPSYNQGQYLEETLLSVISQKTDEVEILVLDAGSTDNSVEIIQRHADALAYWHSRKDNGQSDAINQGIRLAKGKFVTWLNSDDVYLQGAVATILHNIKTYGDTTAWFLGNVVWMEKGGHIIKVGKCERENRFWNRRYIFSNGGPSAFMNREVLLKIGLLREDFHYSMDTELWCRFLSHGYYFLRIKPYVWGLRLHENAKMSGHNFADSPLAQKEHPSWKQRHKEGDEINRLYPVNSFLYTFWRGCKLLTCNFYTRFSDRKWLGKHYADIII